MPHEQDHALNSTSNHNPGTNGTLLGTESGAIAEKAFSTGTTAGHIVQRDGSGDVQVPTTPGTTGAAASKGYVDSLVSGHRAPVTVFRMRDDSLNSPPGGEAAGDAFVVGAAPAGAWAAFAQGDIVEWSGAAWVKVLTNSGNEPPDGTRVVVHSAGLGGSFAGHANKIAQYNATTNVWTMTTPGDGDQVAVIGEGGYFENQQFIYDAVPGAWLSMGSAVPHNSLAGLQGGTAGEYYHFTQAQHTELVRFKSDVTQAAVAPSLPGTWVLGDRGIIITTTGVRRVWWCYVDTGPTLVAVRLS